VPNVPGVTKLLEKVIMWPEVWQSDEVSVYQNPAP
jgi:hypothetical protein